MCWLADRGRSEDGTSLRGVAVNPWPRWLSLQGGGGGDGGRRRGCTSRSVWFRGTWWQAEGAARCLIWFLSMRRFHLPHHPSSENRVWEAGQCQREVTYFMSRFKGDGGLPTKEKAAESWWMPWHTVTCLFTRCCSFVTTTINGSFPLFNALTLRLLTTSSSTWWGWRTEREAPLKELHSVHPSHKDDSCQRWQRSIDGLTADSLWNNRNVSREVRGPWCWFL